MSDYVIFETDSLIVTFPVSFPSVGAVTALTGTAEASASPTKGGPTVAAVCVIDGNTVVATWPAGSFSAGVYMVQLKLTIADQVQTVSEKALTVRRSN